MKPGAVTDLKAMLMGMDPQLGERAWCFQPISDAAFIPDTAFAMIREEEGMSCIIPAQAASKDASQFARITLQVHSDLEGVGLTAAVATSLAASGIACNVIAGLHHDHLFVPWDRREDALVLLHKLSADVAR
jgi:hypothetical protein